MRIAVCVKQITDPALPVEFVPAQAGVATTETSGAYCPNPADRAALEEAIRIRQVNPSAEVTVVTLGPAESDYTVRYCLARGADRAIHLLGEAPDAYTAAVVLGQVIKGLSPDLVLCGARSLDDATGQVPPTIAELLEIPQVTGVIRLDLDIETMVATAWRRLERGKREVVECSLPALIAVESCINEPRYVSLHAMQRMSDRNVQRVDLLSLGGPGQPLTQTVKVSPPRPRPKRVSTPDASLSADERMALLFGGGQSQPKKSGGYLEGPVETVVSEIMSFLQKEGLL